MADSLLPILTEWQWANSHLSIARHSGCISMGWDTWTVVNEKGITVFELSDPKSKHYVSGGQIIPPRKPCDLVNDKWIPIYKKLGRTLTIALVMARYTLKQAQAFAETYSEDTEIPQRIRNYMDQIEQTQARWEKGVEKDDPNN